jgi:maltooligosyltrehalose synthase
VVIAPRLWATLLWKDDARLPDGTLWRGTSVPVARSGLGGRYRNLLGGGEALDAGAEGIAMEEALATFPIAVLRKE